jgi:hypothetical protein
MTILEEMFERALRTKKCIVVIDGKGVRELLTRHRQAVHEAKIPWHFVSIDAGPVADDKTESDRP